MLDAIYDRVERLIREERWEDLDQICREVEVDNEPLIALAGYLTTTMHVKDHLPSRPQLCDAIESKVMKSKWWRPDFMNGLR